MGGGALRRRGDHGRPRLEGLEGSQVVESDSVLPVPLGGAQELPVASVIRVHADQFHVEASLLAAADGEAEEAQHQAELRTECQQHHRLPDGVEHAQPEDGEVHVGHGEPHAAPVLVHAHEDERQP